MIEKLQHECTGCLACISVCPKNAIDIVKKDGCFYPKVNIDCINCGKCLKNCHLTVSNLKNPPIKSYGAKAKETEILSESQSGGMSFVLGRSVIEMGGIVYGAALCDDFVTRHIRCENIEALHKTQGSKYVQSYIDKNIYISIKNDLENNKKVLFTGTPCQTAAIKTLYGKYENLFLTDIICHGVMPSDLFKSYIDFAEKKYGKIIGFSFRDQKEYFWGQFTERLDIINNSKFVSYWNTIFLNFFMLRKCCYNCKYKDKNRVGDITIGDFWEVEKEEPELYDKKGVSALIINSEKGKCLFDSIKNKIIFKETSFDKIARNNGDLVGNKKYPDKFYKQRLKFIKAFDKNGFESVWKYYLFITRIKNLKSLSYYKSKIKSLLMKIKIK